MAEYDCSSPESVDCSKPECSKQCGTLGWFGNLSECTVMLQYQSSDGDVWHSLGTYGPQEHTELGRGVLLLPREVNLRAIQITGSPDDLTHPKVLVNWGRLGISAPSLFVDPSMCSPQDSKVSQMVARGCPKCPSCPPCLTVPDSLKNIALIAVIIAVIVLAWVLYKRLR